MKTNLTASILVSVTVLLAGCNDSNKQPTVADELNAAKDQTQEAADNLKDYTYAQKSEFVDHMQKQLDALDQKISDLSSKIESSSDQVKADAKPKLQALKDKAAQLKDKLAEVKNANESTWDNVKADAQDALDNLQDGFQNARQWVSDKIAP